MNAADALHHFDTSSPLSDVKIEDKLSANPDGAIDCLRCNFFHFSAPLIHFFNSVHFTSCTFQTLDFYGAYFHRGFSMTNCTVSKRLSFAAGGHNDCGAIIIRDTSFQSFVDFEDCWFTGAIYLRNVSFQGGTNLLGNKSTPYEVRFDIPPELYDVTGDLHVDTDPHSDTVK